MVQLAEIQQNQSRRTVKSRPHINITIFLQTYTLQTNILKQILTYNSPQGVNFGYNFLLGYIVMNLEYYGSSLQGKSTHTTFYVSKLNIFYKFRLSKFRSLIGSFLKHLSFVTRENRNIEYHIIYNSRKKKQSYLVKWMEFP